MKAIKRQYFQWQAWAHGFCRQQGNPKEMLPVGRQAADQYAAEEAVAAGIDTVIFMWAATSVPVRITDSLSWNVSWKPNPRSVLEVLRHSAEPATKLLRFHSTSARRLDWDMLAVCIARPICQ
jgi:hypothetical protein